jgi:hypothetical protein
MQRGDLKLPVEVAVEVKSHMEFFKVLQSCPELVGSIILLSGAPWPEKFLEIYRFPGTT